MEALPIHSLYTDPGRAASRALCGRDIAGASPFDHSLPAGASLDLTPDGAYHILILIEGEAVFTTAGQAYAWTERAVFIPAPDADCRVEAKTAVHLLEIRWQIREGDAEMAREYGTVFPYQVSYARSRQYRDPYKSDKTISRVMVEQRTIPRFAMGSVESWGPDFVLSHAHPSLDQFFVSFPENDMFVLIDYEPFRMRGNEMLHIPLGSMHGVDVTEKKHLHYLWIDFMVSDDSLHQLDTLHKNTDTLRAFDEKGEEA